MEKKIARVFSQYLIDFGLLNVLSKREFLSQVEKEDNNLDLQIGKSTRNENLIFDIYFQNKIANAMVKYINQLSEEKKKQLCIGIFSKFKEAYGKKGKKVADLLNFLVLKKIRKVFNRWKKKSKKYNKSISKYVVKNKRKNKIKKGEKLEEDERTKEFTFQPKINPYKFSVNDNEVNVHQRLYDNKKKKLIEKNLLVSFPFRPMINKSKNKENDFDSREVYQRLYDDKKKREDKMKKKVNEITIPFTFHPQINNKHSLNDMESKEVYQRLFDDRKDREERMKLMKEEKIKYLSEIATFTPMKLSNSTKFLNNYDFNERLKNYDEHKAESIKKIQSGKEEYPFCPKINKCKSHRKRNDFIKKNSFERNEERCRLSEQEKQEITNRIIKKLFMEREKKEQDLFDFEEEKLEMS